ncbi:hypothetical protein ILUMI_21987 [Ignelater luminosus]|uniref:Uncharacterized protein n=1 Tax=Ignelater luminosus TaxID=2038154 RepID=A0A8K0FXL8_IGNLU|nr:hypothetical protein ILUMI_21987 [Ignelater luminosus]
MACYGSETSSMLYTYKLFTSIIKSRIKRKIENNQPIEKARFRSGYSTVDHLYVVNQVTERFQEYNKEVHTAFIYFKKALEHQDILAKYIRLIKEIYTEGTAKIN